jgi:mannitol/fructose-specific phosphotransferase system IIA component (Ntr-type)
MLAELAQFLEDEGRREQLRMAHSTEEVLEAIRDF